IGVSFFHLERIEDFHNAFKEADKLLYNAKEQDRNRVNSSYGVNSVKKTIS
ncbi:GGDEF domain-containing protein, partial [Pectobacterium parmentieri]|nr:GGDEF domain-containing protein [Pectobacterium parmentieri]